MLNPKDRYWVVVADSGKARILERIEPEIDLVASWERWSFGEVDVTDGELRLVGDAFADFKAGRFEQAAAKYRALLAEEPGLAEAWQYLGHSLLRLGRPAEALDAYQHQMAIAGGPQTGQRGRAHRSSARHRPYRTQRR